METKSFWSSSASLPRFESLSHDLEVDVAMIGDGLTGVTTAYLLKKEKMKVALLERHRCAGADTDRTTAHLTYVTDERLHKLVKNFEREKAKTFWEAGMTRIDQISDIIRNEKIDCEFKWMPDYLHAQLKPKDKQDRELLKQNAQLAKELGFSAVLVESVPYANRVGIRFDHQTKMHPIKYLAPLLHSIHGNGSYVFENTEAEEIEDSPMTIANNGYKMRCNYLMIATHNPLLGKTDLASGTLFQTKLALYTSYVLGAMLRRGLVSEALYWDTADPYYYLRIDRHADHDYAIFGGEDCKTGQKGDAEAVFQRLETQLEKVLPQAQVRHRWLNQMIETNDGLPFIKKNASQQFIATGYSGNGFTLGTLGAVMAQDRYLGRKNP